MINVCFIQHAGEHTPISKVARFLEKDGIRVKFVAKSREAFDEYKKAGFEVYFISEIFNQGSEITPEELYALDLKYGPHGIKGICDSDVHLRYIYKNEKDREQLVARVYKFWEDFFKNHEVDYVLVRETATFATRTAYNVARSKGRPLVRKIQIGPGDGYFTICDVGEEYCWSELLSVLSDGPRPISEAQKYFVLEFVQEVLARKRKPTNIRYISTPTLSFFRSFIGSYRKDTKKSS